MICVGGGPDGAGSAGRIVVVTVVPASFFAVVSWPHDMPANSTPVTLMLTPPTRIRLAAAAWRRTRRRPRPVADGSVIRVVGLVLVFLLGLVAVVRLG
jgi:hypothetical protein